MRSAEQYSEGRKAFRCEAQKEDDEKKLTLMKPATRVDFK